MKCYLHLIRQNRTFFISPCTGTTEAALKHTRMLLSYGKYTRTLLYPLYYNTQRQFYFANPSGKVEGSEKKLTGNICEIKFRTADRHITRDYNNFQGSIIPWKQNDKSNKELQSRTKETKYFENALQKETTVASFLGAVESFKNDDKYGRKHMKFIRTGMEYIDHFNLQKNVEVYNALIDVFPRDKFNTKRFLDTLWARPHPQVYLTLELLTKMEENRVRPDFDTYTYCMEVFGAGSLPVRKCYRLAYWLAIFENMNPYRLPEEVYKEKVNVCKAAIDRINLGDEKDLAVYSLEENADGEEKKFIIGSIMKNQENVLEKLDPNITLYVEGPISMWVNRSQQSFYVLRTDQKHSLLPEDDYNKYYWQDYDEGVVIAMCMTNKKVPDALLEWISTLEEIIKPLKDFKIVFDIKDTDNEEASTLDIPVLEARRPAIGTS